MFFKDGLMTNIGMADLSPFAPDALSANDSFIRLGRPLGKVSSGRPNKVLGRLLHLKKKAHYNKLSVRII